MDLYNRIWYIISHANTLHQLMFDSWEPAVMGEISNKLNNDFTEFANLDNESIWQFVRPIALKWMQDNWPESWFLPMYMTIKEQQESGNYLMMD